MRFLSVAVLLLSKVSRSYVERRADRDLVKGVLCRYRDGTLRHSNYCYGAISIVQSCSGSSLERAKNRIVPNRIIDNLFSA